MVTVEAHDAATSRMVCRGLGSAWDLAVAREQADLGCLQTAVEGSGKWNGSTPFHIGLLPQYSELNPASAWWYIK